jgi:hypothetical protein
MESLIRDIIASLQQDKKKIEAIILALMTDKNSKAEYVVSEKSKDYTDDERTIDFEKNGDTVKIEYNSDLDFVDEIIVDFCTAHNYKAKFDTERPINTRFVTITLKKAELPSSQIEKIFRKRLRTRQHQHNPEKIRVENEPFAQKGEEVEDLPSGKTKTYTGLPM